MSSIVRTSILRAAKRVSLSGYRPAVTAVCAHRSPVSAVLGAETTWAPFVMCARGIVTSNGRSASAVAAEKKPRTKKVEDPNYVKKPLSSYMLFMRDFRKTFKPEEPKKGVIESAKAGGVAWNSLDAASKEKYTAEAQVLRAEYEKIKPPPAPKEPKLKQAPSGYLLFAADFRKTYVRGEDEKTTELFKSLGPAWQNLDAQKKDEYNERSKVLKAEYEAHKAAGTFPDDS